MTKRSFIFSSALVFAFSLLLTACEGFFTNNDLDEKIRAAIDYAHAPTSSFFISADASAGTITPIGKISYKPTDYQNIKFKIKPEYEFIRWNFRYEEIQSGEKYTKQITNPDWWKDYIDIVSEEISEPASTGEITYTLQIQFKKPEENMLIEPVCALKPEVKSFLPEYRMDGVSRESQISVVFNSDINTDTIFFSLEEINAISNTSAVLKNDKNQIYGYEKDEKRFFKNIEILLGSANVNVNDCYGDFSYRQDIKTLFISAKKPVEIVGSVVEVKVHFTDGITNTDGAKMSDATRIFCVNKSTNKKVDLDIKYNDNQPVQHSQLDAFVDQQIIFPQDSSLQFLYWDVTANSQESKEKITIYDESDKSEKMTFCANDVILPSEGVKITAVYKKRPAVATNGFSPQDATGGVEKDSTIAITFDQEINLQSFIDGYKISSNGFDIKDNFATPVLDATDNTKVIINCLTPLVVDKDTTVKITVTIPAGLFYTANVNGTNYNIEAGQEVSYSYKINSNTSDKSHIQFEVDTSKITASGIKASTEYNTDDTFSVTITEKGGYQFTGWSVSHDSDKIQIEQSDTKPGLYKFSLKGKCGSSSTPVRIIPVAKERLRVKKITPAKVSTGVPCDSSIEIYFNHAPGIELCRQKIGIICNGVNVKSSFPTENWTISDVQETDGYKLSIPADSNNRINVTGTSTVEVFFDNNFYYKDGTENIYYGGSGYSYTYTINAETNDKTTLAFGAVTAEGSLADSINGNYSIGKTLDLNFAPSDDYEFLYWYTNDNTNSIVTIADRFQQNTRVTANKVGNVTLYAKCAPKLQVTSFSPASGTAQQKDSNIVIGFNKNSLNKNNFAASITISMDGTPLTENFKAAALSGFTVTFEANQAKRIQLSGSKTVSVTLQNDLFYEYTDDVITTPKRIYMKEAQIKTYTIDESTIDKATVQVTNGNSSAGTIKDDDAGTNFTTTATAYSKDQTFTLNYDLNSAYEFINWTVTSSSGSTAANNVRLSSTTSPTTTVTIIGSATGTATIKANVVEKLKVSSFKITNNSGTITPVTGTVYPKDCNIVIEFSQTPSNVNNVKNNIDIICNGQSVSGYFTPSLSSKTITYTANSNKIPVTSTSTVYVTIKDGIYYTSSGKTVYMANQQEYTYQIDKTTRTKASVKISCDSSYGTIKNADGTSFTTGTASYDIDENLNLQFIPNDDYEFVYWKITPQSGYPSCANNVSVQYLESPNTTIEVKAANSGTVTIEPVCAQKLKITSVKINNQDYYPVTVYEKDSPVTITFNEKISTANLFNKIKLSFQNKTNVVSASDTSKYFTFNESGDSYSTVTFTPVTAKFLNVTDKDLVFISAARDIYYNYTYTINGTSKTKQITMASTYDEYYQVSYESVKKFKISKAVYEHTASGQTESTNSEAVKLITIKPEREDGLYNYGENITVSFPWDSQTYYKVFDNGTNTDVQKKGWLLRKYSPNDNVSSFTGKILSTNDSNNYYWATFQIYTARTDSRTATTSPQTMKLIYNIAAKPELKAIEPMTTREEQTFTCDTPIVMSFTHPVDKSTVHFGSLDYQGNDYLENNLWICVPVDENGKYVPNGKIWNGFRDITEYYDLDTTEGGDKSLVIRPKISILNLFPEFGKEEITVYLMMDEGWCGNTILTSSEKPSGVLSSNYALYTAYKKLFYEVPAQLKDKITTYEMCDFFDCDSDKISEAFKFAAMGEQYCDTQFWIVPLTISSSISNPRMQVSSMTVKFSDKSSNVSENVRLNTLDDLNANKKAISNQSMYVYITPDEDVRGNWSSEDFTIPVYVDIEVTQYTSYNKSTQTITNPSNFAINNGMAVTYKAGTNFTLDPYGGYLGSGMIMDVINFSNFGFSTTDPTNYAVLQMNIKVSSPIYQYPFQKTYYVLYGAL
ncbi:MAG: hypothetical protein K5907_01495 [Treponema sp.]|nr:hypothetical protein [Treponema sp.]